MAPRKSTGRPAGFDRQDALRRAVVVFWERGYEATSLPALLKAMGVARSSFYASFESKRRVMLEALDLYTEELFVDVTAAASAQEEPGRALASALHVVACSKRPSHGCLFLNTVAELAQRDPEVRTRARRHLNRVDRVFRQLLARLGHSTEVASVKSAALMALAAGAIALRKAGESDRRVRALLRQGSVLAD